MKRHATTLSIMIRAIPFFVNVFYFAGFNALFPDSTAIMFFAASSAIWLRVSIAADAICGVSTTLGHFLSSKWSLRSQSSAGSHSKTSSAAPAICFRASARSNAFSSTIGPRAVLMRNAVFFFCLVLRPCFHKHQHGHGWIVRHWYHNSPQPI